jgi:cytochrome c peroxidase
MSAFRRSALAVALVGIVLVLGIAAWPYLKQTSSTWTDDEVKTLTSLSIESLPPLPANPGNAVADDPMAAKFGQQLFFDPRMSANGGISCATCHQPVRRFTDGLQKGQAIATSKRNTPSIVGVAYSPWLYWDGRRDSLWSQALSPLEDPAEHGGNRLQITQLIASDPLYRATYESLFDEFPYLSDQKSVNKVFANIGKSIAAYERLLQPGPSRFDTYVAAVLTGAEGAGQLIFSNDEIQGLQLFIGEAACTQCHNGPLFTNHEFHNTGVISFPGDVPDKGRVAGVREVLANEFNCAGAFSDDPERVCTELEYVRRGPELVGAMRTPSLRNLGSTAPFMHKGQLKTLGDVLQHYNDAPLAMIGHNEAEALQLSTRELHQLEAFLGTLDAPLATSDNWLAPPATQTPTQDVL